MVGDKLNPFDNRERSNTLFQDPVVFAIPLFIASLLLIITAGYILRQRGQEPRARIGVAALLGGAIWMTGYGLEMVCPGLALKFLCKKIRYLGIAVVPTAWLLYTLYYSGRDKWAAFPRSLLFWIIPFITVLLAWTNEFHGWVWVQSEVTPENQPPFFRFPEGPWLLPFTIYSYGQVLAGGVIILASLAGYLRIYRRHIYVILFSALLVAGTRLLDQLDFLPFSHPDLEPYAFVLISLL